ncbi:hypothetical protein D8B22_22495, partial [Verminephrobacter aporrectodeae subsp. tuberculatae]|nr:hypothetical protein [Verminephrobacter aporrectodeae subsp. tuberculatae]
MAVGNAPDTTAPVVSQARISGRSLVLSCTEANDLDALNKPAPGDFAVLVNGVANAV